MAAASAAIATKPRTEIPIFERAPHVSLQEVYSKIPEFTATAKNLLGKNSSMPLDNLPCFSKNEGAGFSLMKTAGGYSVLRTDKVKENSRRGVFFAGTDAASSSMQCNGKLFKEGSKELYSFNLLMTYLSLQSGEMNRVGQSSAKK